MLQFSNAALESFKSGLRTGQITNPQEGSSFLVDQSLVEFADGQPKQVTFVGAVVESRTSSKTKDGVATDQLVQKAIGKFRIGDKEFLCRAHSSVLVALEMAEKKTAACLFTSGPITVGRNEGKFWLGIRLVNPPSEAKILEYLDTTFKNVEAQVTVN
jgi:hypothetical protein